MKGNKFGRIFLVVFIVGTIIEFCGAMLMRPALEANGGVPWRTDLTALGYVGFLLIGIIYAFSFTFIFLQGYRGHGPVEGVRFGIWATLLASVAPNLAYGLMLPEGRKVPVEFIAVDFITFLVTGAIAAALAGKSESGRAAGA
ncbi:MAG TPA: hypothetical protein VN690_12450 [Terriglobales bacterium]|nr:hypothetical protein [Terriglobales bacterium]